MNRSQRRAAEQHHGLKRGLRWRHLQTDGTWLLKRDNVTDIQPDFKLRVTFVDNDPISVRRTHT